MLIAVCGLVALAALNVLSPGASPAKDQSNVVEPGRAAALIAHSNERENRAVAPGTLPTGSLPVANINVANLDDPLFESSLIPQRSVRSLELSDLAATARVPDPPIDRATTKPTTAIDTSRALVRRNRTSLISGAWGNTAGKFTARIDFNPYRIRRAFRPIDARGIWPDRVAPASSNPLNELLAIERRIAKFAPDIRRSIVSVEGGSGFIASPDGLIITAAHVTKTAGRKVFVQLPDGTMMRGMTLGSNGSTDLGAVQLDDRGPWPSLEIGDPAGLEPGDWCVSMGYPITFARNQPAAIRTGRVLTTNGNRITTDCVIMGGDSGGPLLDTYGKVIGINVGVTTDINKNIHMPVDRFIDDARTILAGVDLRSPGAIEGQTWLGVRGVTDTNIVRVRSVKSGSPAEKAGLKSDDVILGIDGDKIESFSQMIRIVRAHNDGDVIVARLNRFGQVIDLPVRLEKY